MRVLFVVILAIFTLGAGFKTQSLDDAVSIIHLPDGRFDVLCYDHTREVVDKKDIQDDNVCPHIPSDPGNKVDILFVVDNSGTMASSQAMLAEFADEIVADLNTQRVDYRIAVITTEAYKSYFTHDHAWSRFRSFAGVRVVTPSTPEGDRILAGLIPQGIRGSGDERAFSSFKAALQNPFNRSFLRPESQLKIVILSDEDDFSSDSPSWSDDYGNPRLHPVSHYATYLDHLANINGQHKKPSVHTISILDQDCLAKLDRHNRGTRKVGRRYVELAEATGGEMISLCEPVMPSLAR